MDGGPADIGPSVPLWALGRLMPMALWLSETGHIQAAGPTLVRLGSGPLVGSRFLELFDVNRPVRVHAISDLAALAGRRLNLTLRGRNPTPLRGIAVALGHGQGLIVNLSFGIGVAEAVRTHGLTAADFAPTDLTVELLYLTEVKAAVTRELAAMNGRLQGAREDAERQAVTDPLTGIANRRGFEAAMLRAVAAAGRGVGFVLMHLDLDRFKAVNDTWGHAAGDAVLAAVADVLRANTRAADTIARIGGDEFALILAPFSDEDGLDALGHRIIEGIERPVPFEGGVLSVSASIGACVGPAFSQAQPDALQAEADEALYAAKRAGRGRCIVRHPVGRSTSEGAS